MRQKGLGPGGRYFNPAIFRLTGSILSESNSIGYGKSQSMGSPSSHRSNHISIEEKLPKLTHTTELMLKLIIVTSPKHA